MKPTQFVLIVFMIGGEVASNWSPNDNFYNHFDPMAWIDGHYRSDKSSEIDTFFDRLVSISYYYKTLKDRKHSNEATGVVITTDLILTSFNAFRNISTQAKSMEKMNVYVLTTRIMQMDGSKFSYFPVDLSSYTIICGRQVVLAIDYESRPDDMRHGPHSPLHDLMVMRLHKPLIFVTPVPPVKHDFSDYKTWKMVITFEYKILEDKQDDTKNEKLAHAYQKFGPIKTVLAKPGDTLTPDKMEFASIAHISDAHIKENRYLEKGKFGDIVNCDEWILREWGLFICLKNTENYPGLASGAVLYSDQKLFGIGSFVVQKGDESILVFTDVRPYSGLLDRTCTDQDMKL